MAADSRPTGEQPIHATALVLGEVGVLVRGPSGAGKSRLAKTLIDDATLFPDAVRLVGDDRIWLWEANGRLLARGDRRLAGLIEQRGEGILTVAYETSVVVRCVVDFVDPQPERDIPPRLPSQSEAVISLGNVSLPRLALPKTISGPEAADRVRAFVHRLTAEN